MSFYDDDMCIAKRADNIYYLLHKYAYNLEIRDLDENIRLCIIEIIKLLVINRCISHDIKILLIPNDFILQKIFDIFGIKINLKIFYSKFLLNEYEKSFLKLIKNSINDIDKILVKYDYEIDNNEIDNNEIDETDDEESDSYISDDDEYGYITEDDYVIDNNEIDESDDDNDDGNGNNNNGNNNNGNNNNDYISSSDNEIDDDSNDIKKRYKKHFTYNFY